MCIKKSFYLSIFALFAVLFGSCIITSSDVSAVSDFTFTFDSSSLYDSVRPCSASSSSINLNSEPCSSYNYIILDFDLTSSSVYGTLTFNNSSSFTLSSSAFSSSSFVFSISSLSSSATPRLHLYNLSSLSPSGFVRIRAVSSLPSDIYSCPACPTCPEIPENPYDDKLDSIRNAIILVPAVCLLLYFFYVIFGIIIPTTGGKK